MKKMRSIFLFALIFFSCSLKAITIEVDFLISFLSIPDSVIIDSIDFEDMNDTYNIRQYKINDNIVQMDIDRKDSSVEIDYILWDMDKNGRMEAIAVYNVLEQKYDYHLIEHDLAADDLLEFQVQLKDIGFPSFYDSSEIPKAIYKSKEHQPEINHF